MPSIPAAKHATYTDPVPCQALNTGTISPMASDVTQAALVLGSRHTYCRLRSMTVPVRPAGSSRPSPLDDRSRPADSALGSVDPSGEVISRVRCRVHTPTSATSAPAVSASWTAARPYDPSPTACTAPIADAGGTHWSTSATGSSSPRPAEPSR